MEQASNNIIFMISQPRSGSTLLQRMLGSHSKIYTRSEPWIMLHSLYDMAKYRSYADYNREWSQIAENDFISGLPEGGEAFYLKALRQFHMSLYSSYLKKNKKKLFLDKTPRYYFIANELPKLFPDAFYILLIRNPIAVLHSIIKTWIKGDWSKLYLYKHDLIVAIEKNLELLSMSESQYLTIYYEKLLDAPEDILKDICFFCNIKYEDTMSTYYKQKQERWLMGDPENSHTKQGIDPSNINSFIKDKLDMQEWRVLHDYLEYIGESRFELLGYNYKETFGYLMDNMPVVDSIKDLEDETSTLMDLLDYEAKEIKYKTPKFSKVFNNLHTSIEEVLNQSDMFYIYGAGHIGNIIYQKSPESIYAFIDQNPESVVVKSSIQVIKPEKINLMPDFPIIITVVDNAESIKNYLHEELKIELKRIYTLKLDE